MEAPHWPDHQQPRGERSRAPRPGSNPCSATGPLQTGASHLANPKHHVHTCDEGLMTPARVCRLVALNAVTCNVLRMEPGTVWVRTNELIKQTTLSEYDTSAATLLWPIVLPSLCCRKKSDRQTEEERSLIRMLRKGAPRWLGGLSLQLLVSAQVAISWSVGWSPASGSALPAQSLLRILSLPLSLPLPCSCSLSQNKLWEQKRMLRRVQHIHGE